MATTSRRRPSSLSEPELRRKIGLDEFRPGSARARLIEESIPVWAIIGYIGAIAGTTDPDAITDDVVTETGTAYGVSREAVEAAGLYYLEHRGPIDGLLEANEMLPKP